MKRILIDYRKLDHSVAARLIDSYPYGYGDDDIITLKKPSGEIVEAVEVRTEDTIYLVKISKSLSNFISSFEENIEKELVKKEEPEVAFPAEGEVHPNNDLESDGENESDPLF
ncbi:hypothetical protein [Flagellimonas allohymeniacidonis]|uniref:Uncharacterized protein n=1 Tax=Flagellimonas allohymeniacidonis TaxID=2517819 RepID=A0A4Q8QJ25_9FLAO|nr:hypothetical protein [Allomuricauda hymeniacidonis]TAI48723.1 hypothetical protein EW142_02675 [Allomuricauda hymeniacidonis]